MSSSSEIIDLPLTLHISVAAKGKLNQRAAASGADLAGR
jgi:hypothetical protein